VLGESDEFKRLRRAIDNADGNRERALGSTEILGR
jgi:hypothetical protein